MSDSDTDSSLPMVAEDITGDEYYDDNESYNSDSDYESDEDQQLMEQPLTIRHNEREYTISTKLRQTVPPGTDLSGFDFSTIPRTTDNTSIDGRLNLRGANLQGVNLSNCNLENVDLSYADLNNANLSNSILRFDIFRGTSLMGTNLSNLQTATNAIFDNCIINPTTNFNGTNLTGVKFPDWVVQVEDRNLSLTEGQMRQLYQNRFNIFRGDEDDLEELIDEYAVEPSQTREQQIESMRQATTNLQSRAEQLASVLEDKPDRGYGECPICLKGFQPDEIVVDVHPEYNNYKGSTHKFHKDCILPICNNLKPECPLCRNSINCENIKKAGTGAEGTGEVIMPRLQGGKRSKRSKSIKRKVTRRIRRVTNKKGKRRRQTNKKIKKGKRRVTNKKISRRVRRY